MNKVIFKSEIGEMFNILTPHTQFQVYTDPEEVEAFYHLPY